MNTRTHIRILYISLVLMSLLCVSCRPKGVLSNRQMITVLTDLHRMDGMLQVTGYQHGRNDDEAGYYDAVLSKHHVTRAEFDSSLVWYTHHPQRFNKLYPHVIKRLEDEHALFVDESTRMKEFRQIRDNHYRIFTCERVTYAFRHGYPLQDYRLPPIDTLDVIAPLLIRLDTEEQEQQAPETEQKDE